MTDNEIKKALECCIVRGNCQGCPLWNEHTTKCLETAITNALDLINRLQAQNYELFETIDYRAKKITELVDKLKTAKAENERLKGEVSNARRKALLEAKEKFAGHSDYHGDTILCKLICMAEGEEVGNAKPLDKSKIKAEAYKEFAERLKKESYERIDLTAYVEVSAIDDVLKELVGE